MSAAALAPLRFRLGGMRSQSALVSSLNEFFRAISYLAVRAAVVSGSNMFPAIAAQVRRPS
jgi:hypothetical protein